MGDGLLDADSRWKGVHAKDGEKRKGKRGRPSKRCQNVTRKPSDIYHIHRIRHDVSSRPPHIIPQFSKLQIVYVPILDSVRSSLSLSSKPQTADADADTKLHSTSSSRYPKTSGPPSWQQIKKGHSHAFSLRRCTRNAGTVNPPLEKRAASKDTKAGWLATYIHTYT